MRSERPTPNKRRLQIVRWALPLAVALLLTGCRRRQAPPVERAWTTMGTFASITLPASDSNRLDQCAAEAAECFKTLDETFSVYIADSAISQFNSSTGMIAVGWQTLLLLQITTHYAETTGGAFDPTLAPLIQTWGFSGAEQPTALPAADTIEKALEKTGYEHITFEFPSAPSPIGRYRGLSRITTPHESASVTRSPTRPAPRRGLRGNSCGTPSPTRGRPHCSPTTAK